MPDKNISELFILQIKILNINKKENKRKEWLLYVHRHTEAY
jgi:hypothetical protein